MKLSKIQEAILNRASKINDILEAEANIKSHNDAVIHWEQILKGHIKNYGPTGLI